MGNLANLLPEEGHYAEAIKLQRETLDVDTRVLGPEHPQTLRAAENLSFKLGNDNHFADAEKLQQVIAVGSRVLGPEHSDVLKCMNGLAGNYQREGRLGGGREDAKRWKPNGACSDQTSPRRSSP
jgi:eukaryotic-like serine/threonine-protein kinase